MLTTRAAIGTALTPAAPISGLIGSRLIRFINFASSTPDAVPMAKATSPRARMPSVSALRNSSAAELAPHRESEQDRHDVDEFVSRGARQAIRDATLAQQIAEHQRAHQRQPRPERARCRSTGPPIGNRIRSTRRTGRSWTILISRSARVVNSVMIGGWMIGTSAMYE